MKGKKKIEQRERERERKRIMLAFGADLTVTKQLLRQIL